MGPSLKLKNKIKGKIGELNEEKKRLQEKLAKEESDTSYAMRVYGSELAGDIFDKEKRILKDIQSIEVKIGLLEGVLSGQIDISKTAMVTLKSKIGRVDKKIKGLQAEIIKLEEERAPEILLLATIQNAKNILDLKN